MKKLFYLLLFLAATLTGIVTSCSDEPMPEPQEEEWVLPTDTAPISLYGALPGLALYDTIYNCISVEIDAHANYIHPIWFDSTGVSITTIRFIPASNTPEFDFEPGEKFFFKLYSLGNWICNYIPETKTAYFIATLRDKILSRSEMNEENYGIDLLSSSKIEYIPSGLSSDVYVYDKTVSIPFYTLKFL